MAGALAYRLHHSLAVYVPHCNYAYPLLGWRPPTKLHLALKSFWILIQLSWKQGERQARGCAFKSNCSLTYLFFLEWGVCLGWQGEWGLIVGVKRKVGEGRLIILYSDFGVWKWECVLKWCKDNWRINSCYCEWWVKIWEWRGTR